MMLSVCCWNSGTEVRSVPGSIGGRWVERVLLDFFPINFSVVEQGCGSGFRYG